MTLQQTTDTIFKWLKSCTTPEQVNLTAEVFDRYVRYKWWGEGEEKERLAILSFEDALFHQKLSVTSIEAQTGAFAE